MAKKPPPPSATRDRRSGNPARRTPPPESPAGDRAWSPERRADLAIWLLVIAVLVWVPGGYSRFVVAKLLLTCLGIAVAATVPARTRLDRRIVVLFAVGAALFTLAALVGNTPWSSLLGRWPRYEGLPVLAIYAGCAWAGARLLDRPARTTSLLVATAAMSCILGVASALASIGWNVVGSSDLVRSGSLLGNATDQGLVGMVGVALLFRPALDTRRELYLFGLAGAAATTVLSGSRVALAITVLVLISQAVAGQARSRRPSVGTWGPVAAGAGVLLAAALLVPGVRDRLLQGDTAEGRWLAWQMSAEMAGDRWWLGWGPSRYLDAVGGYETPAWHEWAGPRAELDSPHNWLLQVQLAGGLPLLLCALALVAGTAWLGWRAVAARPELLGVFLAVGGYGVAMLVNFTNPTSTCLVAFLAGALVAVPAPEGSGRRARLVDGGVGVGAAALSVVLLVACVSEVVLNRGFTQAIAGDAAAASSTLDTATTLRPGDPDAHLLSAQHLARLANDTGEATTRDIAGGAAVGHARAALARTPDSYQARLALGIALLALERPEEAYAVLDAAADDFPLRGGVLVQRGLASYALGDVDAARADLERAIALGDLTAATVLDRLDAP